MVVKLLRAGMAGWLACGAANAALAAPEGASARPPNIVFVLADDLGWTDTGVETLPLWMPEGTMQRSHPTHVFAKALPPRDTQPR